MNFAKKMRELRIKENLSLAELANLLDTSASTLSKYENGEMLPKIDTLVLMCMMLNCTTDQILGLESGHGFTPLTKECATIIESMTGTQKQWIYLVIDGVKNNLSNLEKSFRLRDDFIKKNKTPRLKM